jgi:tetratricopeptide (TPR) repeat protein
MKQMYKEAINNFNKVLELDPEYSNAYNFLAYTYAEMANYETAIKYFKRYASLSPGDANPFDSMGDLYFKSGDLDKALIKYKEAIEIKPGFFSGCSIAYIYALKENYSEAMKWLNDFIVSNPTPGKKAQGYLLKGFYHMLLGQYKQALIDISKTKVLMKVAGNEYGVAVGTMMTGCIYIECKEYKLSRNCFEESQVVVKNLLYRYDQFAIIQAFAWLDILEGKIDSAKTKIVKSESLLPELLEEYSIRRNKIKFSLKSLNMEIRLAEGAYEDAISLGEKQDSLDVATMDIKNLIAENLPFLQGVLPRAYYLNGELNKAIAEYERLITFNPKSKDRRLIQPKYHYRLAKLYEEKGLKEKAIGELKKFLGLWKEADKDTPELIDAKSRLTKLLASEKKDTEL